MTLIVAVHEFKNIKNLREVKSWDFFIKGSSLSDPIKELSSSDKLKGDVGNRLLSTILVDILAFVVPTMYLNNVRMFKTFKSLDLSI